ncbi:nucleotidyltransferase domain-containing protein [Priestia megaterium]|uniref:nucleotidyltransferase domain-containing protein n=1 Tax=Priestia TaxID=2800373 RepID=UPI00049221A3|nr:MULTISPECIES: nucleotidyltransferase domain-containing protein [Priestia]MED3820863.1 nucleotidyltransferase domain-containing protein [Priestia aryabhattai]QSF35261.1 nucleotidyltransferase domain-containing protein [Priestia megaterium]WJN43293.1 nucleotidyltransferase domain-containing protein [Priestia aryabhattai]WKG32541.1 nucleotidyltransferase domain-containing protein [Priestia aryabhattai]
MKELKKLEPLQAATQFISKHYPNCQGALLAGSVVRGEATHTSDLDLVIFDDSFTSSFRESLIEFGWAIEVFAHNPTSYQVFFKSDCKRARPSLPRMISEGIILVDKGVIQSIKKEAKQLLEKGPEKWSEETIELKRYFVSDALDDLIGSSNTGEALFIANTLAYITHEFVLRTNGHWIGDSKWIVRSLNHYNERFSKEFVEAFDTFYKTGNKDKVIQLVDKVLEPYGGRLFEGFSLGKERANQ